MPATKHFLVIVGAAILLWFVATARARYIDECVKSGHSRAYCEFEFWK